MKPPPAFATLPKVSAGSHPMVFRRLVLVLALTLATPARAGDPPPAAAVADDEAHQAELLGYARTLIVQGQPQDAITRYLNPVLAHYGAAYARETRQLYGSRGPTETLFYMLQAASEKNRRSPSRQPGAKRCSPRVLRWSISGGTTKRDCCLKRLSRCHR